MTLSFTEPRSAVEADDARSRIPLARAWTNAREQELVAQVLQSGCMSRGPMLREFERTVAEWSGLAHAVAVPTAAVALRFALIDAGLEPGDEVVTTPFAHASLGHLARISGWTVRIIDIDADTSEPSPEAIDAACTDRTRAVVVPHLAGWPIDTRAIVATAAARSVHVVEDGSDTAGGMVNGSRVGTVSGAPFVLDFGPGRAATCGEGGVICTDNEEQAERWRSIVQHPLSEISAAVGLAQVEKLPRMLALRREIAGDYTRELANVTGVTVPRADTLEQRRGWGGYVVLLDPGVDRSRVIAHMRAAGVEVAPYLPPADAGVVEQWTSAAPNAASLAARSLALPLHPHLSPHEQREVVARLAEALTAG